MANMGGGGMDAETHGVSRACSMSADAIKLFQCDAVNVYHQFEPARLWPNFESEIEHHAEVEQFKSSAETSCKSNNQTESKRNDIQTVTTSTNDIHESEEERRTTNIHDKKQGQISKHAEHRNGEAKDNSSKRHKHNIILTPTVKGAVVIQAFGHVRHRRTQGGDLGEPRFLGREYGVREVSRCATGWPSFEKYVSRT